MASDLKGRLSRIKSLGLAGTSGSGARKSEVRARPAFLEGWTKKADFLWSRTLSFDFRFAANLDPACFAPLRRNGLGRGRNLRAPGEAKAAPRLGAEALRFFDLETTGLSGGAGTIAFLAAVGRPAGSRFELTQLFLEDFPGERAFVEAVLELLEGDAVVSYNGKAFDMPLLRTRCVMSGVAVPAHRHIDALFVARRLWKSVYGGAGLELLEREVLGLDRGEDIPGSMIPEIWLGFARSGEAPLMSLVLSHNAADVVALARLTGRIQAIFDAPNPKAACPGTDLSGLGRSLMAIGREREGEALMEEAAGDGDGRAALYIMRQYRMAARGEDCLRILPILPSGYKASVEKAKLYERLAPDLEKALEWAREAQAAAVGESSREAAARRVRRIEGKLGKGASANSPGEGT